MLNVEGGQAMTEADWVGCEFPLQLFGCLGARVSARKYRLLMCAWLSEKEFADERSAAAVLIAGRFADGDASEMEREQAHTAACQAHERWREARDSWASFLAGAAAHAVSAIDIAVLAQKWTTGIEHQQRLGLPFQPDVAYCQRMRDIFGNPFRPVAFSPAWRTDTAVALARQMYESREFGAMPILADALQDAGCEDEHILNHCRDANATHVRGCWVVDLVLGKE
jgi:hypothetical protein